MPALDLRLFAQIHYRGIQLHHSHLSAFPCIDIYWNLTVEPRSYIIKKTRNGVTGLAFNFVLKNNNILFLSGRSC